MIAIVTGIFLIWLSSKATADELSIHGKCPILAVENLNSISVPNLNQWQLPTHGQIAIDGHVGGVSPIHYNIWINVTNTTFIDTVVDIEFAVRKSTDRIVLNLKTDGNVASFIQLIDSDNRQEICAKAVRNLIDLETLIVELDQTVQEDQFLTIKLSNQFVEAKSKELGFILETIDKDHWSMTTILETEWARYLFPCFDHPSLKVTFQLTLERSSDTLAGSNTPLMKSVPIGKDRVIDSYSKTKPLPIYLFTFCVTKGFELQRYKIDKQTEIDIFHYNHSSVLKSIDKTARDTLRQMRQITGVEYHLPKLGFIIVDMPSPITGMENDGLIWLNHPRQTKFSNILNDQSTVIKSLYSSKRKTPDLEGDVATVIHEVVHLWIGNLLTVATWPEVCLQEGLTTYLESTLMNTKLSFGKRLQVEVLGQPLLLNNNNITGNCYNKGRDFFSMLAGYYGKDKIFGYIKDLANKYLNKNANLDQWAEQFSLSMSDPSAKQMFVQWFKQSEIVLLMTSLTYDSKSVVVDQQLIPLNHERRKLKPLPLPLTLLTSRHETKSIVLEDRVDIIQLRAEADMYIFDPQDTSLIFYTYDRSEYEKFANCYENYDEPSCTFLNEQKILRVFSDLCSVARLQVEWLPSITACYIKGFGKVYDRLTQLSLCQFDFANKCENLIDRVIFD